MKRLMCALGAVLTVGCQTGSGVLYGFVVDGVTGERLNFFTDNNGLENTKDDPASTNQVYSVVNGAFIRAKPCDAKDATAGNLIDTSGCFKLANLTTAESLPVFAQRSGYQPFEGVVQVPAHGLFANIRMFSTGFNVDYGLVVTYLGAPIEGATVDCQYRATDNAFQVAGQFIAPTPSTTAPAQRVTTDSDGLALLAGSTLVLGAEYHCEAFRRDALNQNVLAGQASFVAGVASPQVAIAMGSNAADPQAIYAIRSNADDPNDLLGNNAQLVITFNRSVELVPGTADCMTATLDEPDSNGNNTQGALPTSTFNNGNSEQVNAQVSTDGRTLTLAYRTPTQPLDTGDRGTSVSFRGIYVRPAGGTDDGQAVRNLGGATSCNADDNAPMAGAPPLLNLRVGGQQTETVQLF